MESKVSYTITIVSHPRLGSFEQLAPSQFGNRKEVPAFGHISFSSRRFTYAHRLVSYS
jgi:hypothetical protein